MSITGWHALQRKWLTIPYDRTHHTAAQTAQWYDEHFGTQIGVHTAVTEPPVLLEDTNDPVPPEIIELIRNRSDPETFRTLNSLSTDTRSLWPEARFAYVVPRQTLQRCRLAQLQGNTSEQLLPIARMCANRLSSEDVYGKLECNIDWVLLADKIARYVVLGDSIDTVVCILICNGEFEMAREIVSTLIPPFSPRITFTPQRTTRYYPGMVDVIHELTRVIGPHAYRYINWFKRVSHSGNDVEWSPTKDNHITIQLIVDMARNGLVSSITVVDESWGETFSVIGNALAQLSQEDFTIAQSLTDHPAFHQGGCTTPQGMAWASTQPYQPDSSYCELDSCDAGLKVSIVITESINFEMGQVHSIGLVMTNLPRSRPPLTLIDYETMWSQLREWPQLDKDIHYQIYDVRKVMKHDLSLIYCSREEYQRRMILYTSL